MEWITRPSPSPTASPNQSDDEDIDVVVENSDMVCVLEGSVDEDDNENE